MTEPAYRLVRPARPPAAAPVLDAAQRAVVDHPGGPLLVLAGPGTGKTTTLVEAVVARAARGVPVDQMLMVTFSRRAANEMRTRVSARLGGTVREPIARTLHSYAFGVLRLANQRGADDLSEPLPPPRLLAGAEQDIIVRELLAGRDPDRWPAELRPALRAQAFAAELRDFLLRAVERGLTGPDLARLGSAGGRPDWAAAGDFLTEYQNVTSLAKPGAYDPGELIRAAVDALLADPGLLAAERSRRRRIFVDEYQDTDPAQITLLQLLADGADELVLVGDPDQSIYAFRGAAETAIRDVDLHYHGGAGVATIALQVSRRCGPQLLAASRRVAARLPGRGEQRGLTTAETAEGAEPPVEVALFPTASAEADYLAGVLRRAHLDGLAWSRMAVLVRSTAAVLGTLRRALITAGVPVAVRGEDLPLAEQPAVAVLLDVVRCVIAPLTEDAAQTLLIGPIGGADIVYLQRLRRVLHQRADLDELPLLAPLLGDPREVAMLPEPLRWPLQRVQRALAAGHAAVAANAGPETVLWDIWDATTLGRRWAAASAAGGTAGAAADRDLDAVVELFDTAARFADRLPRAGIEQFTEHLAAQQVPGAATQRAGEPDAVTILTAHAGKGLEWDLVCVAHVQEGSWPDLRRRGSLLGVERLVDTVAGVELPDHPAAGNAAGRLAEERRLFYVAITRARQRLVVTAVRGEDEQPSRFLDELDPVDDERPLAARRRPAHLGGLVADLRAAVCDPAAEPELAASAATELARLAVAGVRGADPEQWWGTAALSDDGPVADPKRPVPVSPSRIDSFLRCELRTLLQDLGAQDGQQLSASLGTLVHEVAAAAAPDAGLATLEAMLDEQWKSLDFGAAWFADNERLRARDILVRLVEWLHASRAELSLVAIEEPFAAVVGDARLTGRVDRLERDHDGRLVVVDLKTGKSKVKADELPLHPQLGAYQLAVEAGAFGPGRAARRRSARAARRRGQEPRAAAAAAR